MFTNPFIVNNIIPIISFTMTYIVVDYLYRSPRFLSVFRRDGKQHVGETGACSNLIKTIQCVISIIALTYYYITEIRHGNYPNIALRAIIMNFAAVEVLSLIKAKKYYVRKDIVYHHFSAIFLSFLSFMVDFNHNKPGQLIVLFLLMISMTFPHVILHTLKPYYNVKWLTPYAKLSYIISFGGYILYAIYQWISNTSSLGWLLFYCVFMSPLFIANWISVKNLFKGKNIGFLTKPENKDL